MASASAVPSSSSSRHRTPLSVVNSGMKLRDLYAITRSDGLAQWLRRKGLIGDFTDEDCVKCNHGKMRLVNPLTPEIIIAVTPYYGINLLNTTLAIHSTQNIHAFKLKLSIIA